jgi:hypothetical protein
MISSYRIVDYVESRLELAQYGAADSTKEFFMDKSLWKTNDIALAFY